jgi:hypothetical protein
MAGAGSSARSVHGWRLPLSPLHAERLEKLERLVGKEAFLGWGQEKQGPFFVDVLRPSFGREDAPPAAEGELEPSPAVRRSRGPTLHLAIGAALRAAEKDVR